MNQVELLAMADALARIFNCLDKVSR